MEAESKPVQAAKPSQLLIQYSFPAGANRPAGAEETAVKKWKLYHFAIFIVLCLALNYGGRKLAAALNLPLWLDSFGTVLCAYVAGPVCGSIVGITLNLLSGMTNPLSAIYGLTSVTLAIVVGLAAKKRKLDTLFGTMTAASVASIAAIVISIPLNVLFHSGSTGNVWGDGVIGYLREIGCPYLPACAAGQFYIDFLDKTLTLLVLFLALKLVRRVTGWKMTPETRWSTREMARSRASFAHSSGAPANAPPKRSEYPLRRQSADSVARTGWNTSE